MARPLPDGLPSRRRNMLTGRVAVRARGLYLLDKTSAKESYTLLPYPLGTTSRLDLPLTVLQAPLAPTRATTLRGSLPLLQTLVPLLLDSISEHKALHTSCIGNDTVSARYHRLHTLLDCPGNPAVPAPRHPLRPMMPAHALSPASSASSSASAPRDPTAATALLHAAGDDREALAEAIAAAAFLDATPGDHRQKLRGGCGVGAGCVVAWVGEGWVRGRGAAGGCRRARGAAQCSVWSESRWTGLPPAPPLVGLVHLNACERWAGNGHSLPPRLQRKVPLVRRYLILRDSFPYILLCVCPHRP